MAVNNMGAYQPSAANMGAYQTAAGGGGGPPPAPSGDRTDPRSLILTLIRTIIRSIT